MVPLERFANDGDEVVGLENTSSLRKGNANNQFAKEEPSFEVETWTVLDQQNALELTHNLTNLGGSSLPV